MSDPKDTARYDVSTDANNTLASSTGWEGSRETTIRDNQTGQDYRGTGNTDKESRDSAWDAARRDNS